MQSLTIDWGSNGDISASNNGQVNLSGLQSISVRANGQWLQINSTTGGQVNLSGLTNIASAGNGSVQISHDSTSLSLPQLTTAQNTYLNPAAGTPGLCRNSSRLRAS